MTKPISDIALFRLSVLGPLASRTRLPQGELKATLQALAKHRYLRPDGLEVTLSTKTIERWYYHWLRNGVEGLANTSRQDKGRSQLSQAVQQALLEAKRAQPSRSITTLIQLLELEGVVAKGSLSRSSVHRLLVRHHCSKRTVADSTTIERRSFEASHAAQIWYGDVMHGPKVDTAKGQKKAYLVTVMDDYSRLICHSAFYLDETAVSIEHALKEALLKRGLPRMFVLDNGSAYRSGTLKQICARLEIRLHYCRPYEPQGKGKLERWHRSFRATFLAEVQGSGYRHTLEELNNKLWVWLEHSYHQRPHSALPNQVTPLTRWMTDSHAVRPLGKLALTLDRYFFHHIKRSIRKDATLSYKGIFYEVPYEYASQTVFLVVEPCQNQVKWIESLDYEYLGPVFLLDKHANRNRKRQRPETIKVKNHADSNKGGERNLVDQLIKRVQVNTSIIPSKEPSQGD